MAKKFRLELIPEGFTALLTGKEVTEDLQARGRRIASAAGDGFEPKTWQGRYGGSPRSIVAVEAVTAEAKRAEARDRVLTRAKEAGR
ncbi:hypothetical protein [Georgenia sp. MJ170]|uniref:hypothetical protein n=1 Tax=Georgenia sunbinii TaxID=3117728 RepID=UPI002F26B509